MLQESENNEVNEIDLAAFQAASEPVYAAVAESAGEELTQQSVRRRAANRRRQGAGGARPAPSRKGGVHGLGDDRAGEGRPAGGSSAAQVEEATREIELQDPDAGASASIASSTARPRCSACCSLPCSPPWCS